MPDTKIGVYLIFNWVNGKAYVGSSIKLNLRINQHKSDLNKNVHDNRHLQKAWNKYWSVSFDFYIIEYCSKENLIEREQYWIDKFKSSNKNFGYNLAPIAFSVIGVKHTKETIEKRKIANAGFKHTEETKIKLSKLKIGSIVSQETKLKISVANRGRKLPHRRNLTNWPCPEMSKCQCERCISFKRSLALARYYNKKGQAA